MTECFIHASISVYISWVTVLTSHTKSPENTHKKSVGVLLSLVTQFSTPHVNIQGSKKICARGRIYKQTFKIAILYYYRSRCVCSFRSLSWGQRLWPASDWGQDGNREASWPLSSDVTLACTRSGEMPLVYAALCWSFPSDLIWQQRKNRFFPVPFVYFRFVFSLFFLFLACSRFTGFVRLFMK